MSLIVSFSGIRGALGGLSDGIVILGLDGWPKLANRNILLNFGEVPSVLFNLKKGDNNKQDSKIAKWKKGNHCLGNQLRLLRIKASSKTRNSVKGGTFM